MDEKGNWSGSKEWCERKQHVSRLPKRKSWSRAFGKAWINKRMNVELSQSASRCTIFLSVVVAYPWHNKAHNGGWPTETFLLSCCQVHWCVCHYRLEDKRECRPSVQKDLTAQQNCFIGMEFLSLMGSLVAARVPYFVDLTRQGPAIHPLTDTSMSPWHHRDGWKSRDRSSSTTTSLQLREEKMDAPQRVSAITHLQWCCYSQCECIIFEGRTWSVWRRVHMAVCWMGWSRGLHCAKSYRPFELFVNENYKL